MDKPKINPIMSSAAPRGAKQNLRYQPGQVGQNLQNLAGTVSYISQELQRQEARNEQLKMQNFEEQLDNQYKALQNRLAQSQDPALFDAEVSSALEQMKATGKEYLGERLFKRWERDFGANYYDALKNDTDAKKINLLSRINFQTAQDTVRQKAYDYAYAAPEVQRELDRDFESYLELSGLTPLQKQELAGQYDKDKTVSRLHWLFDKDPAQIAYKDKNGKIVSPMDDKKQYTNLTVEEKLSWKNRALRWQQAQEEAAGNEADNLKSQNHQAALKDLYNAAVRDYERNPLALQQDFQAKSKNMFSALEELNAAGIDLTAKEFSSYLSFVEDLLDDPSGRMGQQKINNFAKAQAGYAAFGIDEKTLTITNEDVADPSSLVAGINHLRASIDQGAFNKEDTKKARNMLATMRQALGTMNPEPGDVGKNTVGGDIVRQINALTGGDTAYVLYPETIQDSPQLPGYGLRQAFENAKQQPFNVLDVQGTLRKQTFLRTHDVTPATDPAIEALRRKPQTPYDWESVAVNPLLMPEEKGMLIEDVFARAQEMGINLKTANTADKKKAAEVARAVLHNYLSVKFTPDRDSVSQIQYGDNIINSYAIKPNPSLGAKLQASYADYRLEELNGVYSLVRRDKEGRIIHSQLY